MAGMQRLIWGVEDFLTHEYRGSPLWGWLIIGAFVAFIAITLISVIFFGYVLPNRCDSNGNCWPEY